MEHEQNKRGEPQAIERAERDPVRTEADWLTATEEGTGEQTLNGAQAVVLGADPPGDPDEPIVNGYRGGDRRIEPSVEEMRTMKMPKVPKIDY